MTGAQTPSVCPRCGGTLLWNGRAMACIACSYLSTNVKSEKKIPAARSRQKDRKPGSSS